MILQLDVEKVDKWINKGKYIHKTRKQQSKTQAQKKNVRYLNVKEGDDDTTRARYRAADPPRKHQGGVAPVVPRVNTGCNQKRRQTAALATLALAHLGDSAPLWKTL